MTNCKMANNTPFLITAIQSVAFSPSVHSFNIYPTIAHKR